MSNSMYACKSKEELEEAVFYSFLILEDIPMHILTRQKVWIVNTKNIINISECDASYITI